MAYGEGEATMFSRAARRGFTLIELVIVIAVIAILAALLIPTILNQVQRARVAAERDSIAELAKAFRRFKLETGYWPYENAVWPMQTNVEPSEFTTSDLSLFTMPASGPVTTPCTASNVGSNCWGGPYLVSTGSAGLNPSLTDAWGHPRMFAMIRPFDGFGGGTPGAPNGYVVVWSRGPDGIDQFSCYNGAGCTRDLDRMAQGLPSGVGADDIAVVAGSAQ